MIEREIKFAAVQMEIVPGRPEKNVDKILKELDSARERKVDIVICPEMSVPGYLLGDDWEDDDFLVELMDYNQKILEATQDIAIVYGNVFADFDNIGEDERTRKFNAAYVAQNGKWVNNGIFEGHTFKALLPSYYEFEDKRHFTSLLRIKDVKPNIKKIEDLFQPFPIMIKGKPVMLGVMICEDMWYHKGYPTNPTENLIKNGSEILANISRSPFSWRKDDKRHRVVEHLLEKNPSYFIYNNGVGVEDNGKGIFLFDGKTTFYNKDGSIMLLSEESYKEETLDFTITGRNTEKVERPIASCEMDNKELYDGLVYGIKKFCESKGIKKVDIGLSGGIDSAVSICLLVDALGKENVKAINMPSEFNSDITKNAAKQLSKNLDIDYLIFSIQDSVDLTIKELEEQGFKFNENIDKDRLIVENIQARDRGSRILPAIAACHGAVFVNNSNKTELALGYGTLYGDINGAFSPLGDLFKHEVYQLANYINREKEIIPKTIIDIVPCAELSKEQDVTKGKGDPIIYPYHDKLLRAFIEFRINPKTILELYCNGELEERLKIEPGLINKHFPTPEKFIEDLEKRYKSYKYNYFKRIQFCPIISVSRRSFGFNLRESQTGPHFVLKYEVLKQQILNRQHQL